MKVVHFAPFAPNRCGLYEQARDIVRAERLVGIDSQFCDVGIPNGSKTARDRTVGSVDARSTDDFLLTTIDYDEINDADVFVQHDEMPQSVRDETSQPVVRVMHERPYAVFRSDVDIAPKMGAHMLYAQESRRDRVKAMCHMWPSHTDLWAPFVVREKLRCVGPPPVDESRFCPDGPKHGFDPKDKGDVNILICDIPRADMCAYHAAQAVIQFLECYKDAAGGVKVHFYALKDPLGPWDLLIDHIRKLGHLGETKGMWTEFEKIYRAMDILVTPHRIATRTIAEAACCGCHVVTGDARVGPPGHYACDMLHPDEAAEQIDYTIRDVRTGGNTAYTDGCREWHSSINFGERMLVVYREVLERPVETGAVRPAPSS